MQLVKLLEALKEPHNLGGFPEMQKPIEDALEIARKLPVDDDGHFARLEMRPDILNQIKENKNEQLSGIPKKNFFSETTIRQAKQHFEKMMPDVMLKPIAKKLENKLATLIDALMLEIFVEIALAEKAGEGIEVSEYEKQEIRSLQKRLLQKMKDSMPVGTSADAAKIIAKQKPEKTQSHRFVLDEFEADSKKLDGAYLFDPDAWAPDSLVSRTAESAKHPELLRLMGATNLYSKAYDMIQQLNVALASGLYEGR